MTLTHYLRAIFSAIILMLIAIKTTYAVQQEHLEQVTNPLKSAVAVLMEDYTNRLPKQRDLYVASSDLSQKYWTTNDLVLVNLCKQEETCASFLTEQIHILQLMLEDQKSKKTSVVGDEREAALKQIAVIFSKIDGLCTAADHASKALLGICGSKHQYGYFGSRYWYEFGNIPLALSYKSKLDADNNDYQRWLDSTDQSDLEKQKSRDELVAARAHGIPDAESDEQNDQFNAAREQWLPGISQSSGSSNPQRFLQISLFNLARLSSRMGDQNMAVRWREAYDAFRLKNENTDLESCEYLQQNTRLNIAFSRATGKIFSENHRALLKLQKHHCGLLVVTKELAFAALHAGHTADAIAGIEFTLADCKRTSVCFSQDRQSLSDLLAIAHRDKRELPKMAAHWLNIMNQGALTSDERDQVWVLADALDAMGQDSSVRALALYTALNEQVRIYLRDVVIGIGSAGQQKNIARYDDLTRTSMLANVRGGGVVAPEVIESLRGQQLHARLQRKRWSVELADVRDDKAKTQRDQELVVFENTRKKLKTLVQDDSFSSVFAEAIGQSLDDSEEFSNDTYLNALATQRAGLSHQSLVYGYGLGLSSLEVAFDTSKLGGYSAILNEDEAYLSFLKVPGGYLGVMVPNSSRRDSTHPTVNRFLPVSVSQEKMLTMYRELLMRGAGALRGVTLTKLPMVTDASIGLSLHGLPVWRLQDGSFSAENLAPVGSVRVKSLDEISDAIYKLFLEPFHENWQDAERLIISPDGELSFLPFETLTSHGVSVLESIDIVYVQSLAVYEELKTREINSQAASESKKKIDHRSLLSIADPVFDHRTDSSNWRSLPGTRLESDKLVVLFPNAKQLLGRSANKSELMKQDSSGELASYQILHFATHGYSNDQRAALVLTEDDHPNSGYLSDEDVVTLNLGSDLVLLSACDTGIGRIVVGEGIVGLPYAFFMAGNRNTLMSLWSVDDAGTAAFIPAFMGRVRNGQEVVSALNDTRRAFARGEYGDAFRDPRIWGAFVMYGIAGRLY